MSNDTKKPKVFWKPDESLKVAVKALDSFNAGNEKHFIDALLNAQAMLLAPERQRPRSTLATLARKLRELAMPFIEERDKQAAVEAKQHKEALEAQRHQNALEAQAASLADQVVFPELAAPSDFINDCIETVAQRFKSVLIHRLRAVTEEAFDEIREGVSVRIDSMSTEPTVRVKKMKVVVVGFRSDQGQDILRGMKGAMDLTIISTIGGEGIKRLKEVAPTADFVVVNIKWVGHSHTDIARNHPGYIPFDGGVTACIKRLQDLLANGK